MARILILLSVGFVLAGIPLYYLTNRDQANLLPFLGGSLLHGSRSDADGRGVLQGSLKLVLLELEASRMQGQGGKRWRRKVTRSRCLIIELHN